MDSSASCVDLTLSASKVFSNSSYFPKNAVYNSRYRFMYSRFSSSMARSSLHSLPIARRKDSIWLVSSGSSLGIRSTDIPMALNRTLERILRLRSMLTESWRPVELFFSSVMNSSQVPRLGISSQLYDVLPVFSSYPVEK